MEVQDVGQYEYCCSFLHKLSTYSVKQKTLNKQFYSLSMISIVQCQKSQKLTSGVKST